MAAETTNISNSNTLVSISNPDGATVEIIVVHGINLQGNETHAENTWTHDDTGVNWLRDLLPERVPSARILAFQYNANIIFDTSTAGVEEQAINLLGCLRTARKENAIRPMIFICHSMGGIIVKEALATSWRDHRTYPTIWTFTYALFFLAVPHKGSDYASWGHMASKILSIQPSNSFLESLQPTSRVGEELNDGFRPLHEAYQFNSWVETRGLPGVGIIVPKTSATLGLPACRETIRSTNRDHRSICKFSDADDPEWVILSQKIVEAAGKAARSEHFTPSMQHRQAMFESLHGQERDENSPSIDQAIQQAQGVIDDGGKLFRELEKRRHREVSRAQIELSTIGILLSAILAPILALLSSFTLGIPFQETLARVALATLPARLEDEARDGARQAHEAELKIMEAEAWAIDRLNEHQRRLLRASWSLQRVVRVQGRLQQLGDADQSQLENIRRLQDEVAHELVENTAKIHVAHERYNRAKTLHEKIESAREEVADLSGPDFWIVGAPRANEIRVEQEQSDGEDGGWWSRCVIL